MEIAPKLQFKHYTIREAQLPGDALVSIEAVDLDAVSRLTNGIHEELFCDPVDALLAAGADGDLLVVGSRGLHGVKALGSVSERVAHRASCSTLIVRERAAVQP